VAFIDCTGPEKRASLSPGSTAGTSYQNDAEAKLVAHAVQQLLTGPHAIQPSDIGVITPYSGQVVLSVPSSPLPSPPHPFPSSPLPLLCPPLLNFSLPLFLPFPSPSPPLPGSLPLRLCPPNLPYS